MPCVHFFGGGEQLEKERAHLLKGRGLARLGRVAQ
jgi:hypothetical protein